MFSEMEPLGDSGLFADVPFFDTSGFPERMSVSRELAKTDSPRRLVEPIPFDQYAMSDDSSEDDEDGMVWADSSFANGLSATGFGPGGEDSVGVQLKVHDNEQATDPPTRKLVLKPPRGPPIIVIPRCHPRAVVMTGCVEIAVSEWMEEQRRLPEDQRTHVEVDFVPLTVDGEVKHVGVWRWKGLQQVQGERNTFKICLA